MKLLTSLFLFTILSTHLFSQSAINDQPFGGGGGYLAGWMIPDLKPLNAELAGFGTPSLSESGFYSSGGGGFLYIGFIPHLRVGGVGFTGSTSGTGLVNGYEKEVKYSNSLGGLTVEYSLPFIRRFAVSIGFIAGFGSAQIETYRYRGSQDWNTVISDLGNPNASVDSYGRTMTNNYFLLAPTLNIDYPFHPLVSLRVGAGYSFTFGKEWKLDNGQILNNVPESISGKSFFIQVGIMGGLFFL